MNTTRPTPETDAACWMQDDCEIVNSNFARRLERERDEAREKIDAVSKRAERIRCELVQAEASRVTSARLAASEFQRAGYYEKEALKGGSQLEAMREALKEAHTDVAFALREHNTDGETSLERLEAALTKLQPFLK